MSVLDKFLRRFATKYYIRKEMELNRQAHEEKMKSVGKISKLERHSLLNEFYSTDMELFEWLQSIEDEEWIAEGKKMDVLLSDFPFPPTEEDDYRYQKYSHYQYGEFGSKLLRDETRSALIKDIRGKRPVFMKERREERAFWVNSLIGIMGTAIGIIAVLKS